MPTRVTFIGLGAMGRPMAARIGTLPDVELTVHDVAPAALDAAAGIGRRAETLADAVRDADLVLTMVPADVHVLTLGRALAPLLRPGVVVADFSTVHPDTITTLADLLEPRVQVVSASCMKSVAAAIAGTLTLFVGGDAAAISRLAPALDAMSSHRVDVGSRSAAKSLKLVNNLVVAGLNLVIAEAMVAAARAGLTHAELVARLEAEEIGGWALANQVVKHTLADDLGPGYFSVRYMYKDVALAARLAADRQVPRFLAGPVLAALRGADAIGHGNDYHPVIIRWVERGANTAANTAAEAPDPAVLPTLVRGVGASEKLIATHGLLLAEADGAPLDLAARSLESASASSRSLQRRVAAGFPAEWWQPGDGDLAALAAVRDLAAVLPVPAVAVEASYDYALALRQRAMVPPEKEQCG